MRQVIIALILLGLTSKAQSQNVLGLSTVEVKSYFKSNYPELVLESNIRNDTYRYLKYSDMTSNLTTALIFMSPDGFCSSVRFIYDLSLEDKVIEELDKKFIKTKPDRWIDEKNTGKVNIYFKKEEWYITVNYKHE